MPASPGTTTTAEFFKEGEGRLWLPVLQVEQGAHMVMVVRDDEAVSADELVVEGWELNALLVDQVLPAEPGWYALIQHAVPDELERPPVLAWSLPSGAYVLYPPSHQPDPAPSWIARVVDRHVSSGDGPTEENTGARLLAYHHPQHAPEPPAEVAR